MEGKKIGVLIAVLALASICALPSLTSAVATNSLTITPTGDHWGQTVYISKAISGAYWNGTMYCNLTDPTGNVVHLGGVVVNGVTLAATLHYANWSYLPDVAGTWSVNVTGAKVTGTTVAAWHYQTSSFTQERSMQGVASNINDLSPVILYIAIVLVLFVTLMIVVTRVSGERGGKKE